MNSEPFECWFPKQASRDDIVGELARALRADGKAPKLWTLKNLANFLERENRLGDLMTLMLARSERLRPLPWHLLRESDLGTADPEAPETTSAGLYDQSVADVDVPPLVDEWLDYLAERLAERFLEKDDGGGGVPTDKRCSRS